jgi:hypothetical protein
VWRVRWTGPGPAGTGLVEAVVVEVDAVVFGVIAVDVDVVRAVDEAASPSRNAGRNYLGTVGDFVPE